MRLPQLAQRLVVVAIPLALASCNLHEDAQAPPAAEVVSGTLQLNRGVDVGPCWMIVMTDQSSYELNDLAAEFQVDGLAVQATLHVHRDQITLCSSSFPADVVHIERLE